MRPSPLLLLALSLFAAAPAVRAQTPPPAVAPAPPEAAAPFPATNFFAIETPRGRMVVRLFDETPLHRDNFKRLAEAAYFDSTTFHRVMEGFMIQGGDPNSRNADPRDDGQGGPPYTVPAEIGRFHVRGALAAARQGDEVNPARASSGSQFYVVHGQPLEPGQLDQIQAYVRQATGDAAFAYPPEVAARYAEVGGVPFLDGQYTVFGEVVEGLDVLDALAAADTPRKHGDQSPWGDNPTERLWMTVRPIDGYMPPASAGQ